MSDRIHDSWLTCQLEEVTPLVERSDLIRLQPLDGWPPWRYIVEFRCKGLVRETEQVVEADRFMVGVSFPPDHLRKPRNSWEIVAWIGPTNVWHPNIARAICIGRIAPGTGLVDILYRVYEVITYQKFCPREDNSLNRSACAWARANLDRLPVDTRPLKWRRPDESRVAG